MLYAKSCNGFSKSSVPAGVGQGRTHHSRSAHRGWQRCNQKLMFYRFRLQTIQRRLTPILDDVDHGFTVRLAIDFLHQRNVRFRSMRLRLRKGKLIVINEVRRHDKFSRSSVLEITFDRYLGFRLGKTTLTPAVSRSVDVKAQLLVARFVSND